jgi:selenophosphate synthase
VTVRLTGYAHGGGCACKIPPGELEEAVRGLTGQSGDHVLVGLDDGDDAAAVLVRDDLAVLATADFFTPVVDDAYDWGRIAAANTLSDVYAMGGRPVVAINLVGWPRGVLPLELMTEVLRGGLALAAGVWAATDVASFGLLGHLYKMCWASGVGAVIDRTAVPVIEGAREALRDGFISGGTRCNLDWVRPHLRPAPGVTEQDLLLLADAQTSGGLLIVGELPGHPVIGHTVAGRGIEVR